MKLKKVSVNNFRGIKDFEMEVGDGLTAIIGDNGTGKSTLVDAISWVMFGKPFSAEKNWLPKAITDGEAEPAKAELVFSGEGTETCSLAKVFKEVWKQKKGTVEKTFAGHTTDYYINGVPVNEGAYGEATKDMFGSRGEALSHVGYIMDKMTMQERRAYILSFIEDIDDIAIAASIEGGEVLVELMHGRDINGVATMAKQALKGLNQDIKANQIIYSREYPLGAQYDKEKAAQLEAQRKALTDSLSSHKEFTTAISNMNSDKLNKQTVANNARLIAQDAKVRMTSLSREIEQNKNKAQEYCPTCGARLNEEKLRQLEEKRSRRGEELAAALAEQEARYREHTAKAEEYTRQMDFIDANIRSMQEGLGAELDRISEDIDNINWALSESAQAQAHYEAAQKAAESVKALNAEAEKWERVDYLVKEFTRAKTRAVEREVNAMFNSVKFRMFDLNINGSLKEECEPLIECEGTLVPYKSANTGSKISAGIEIIDCLSRAQGNAAPVLLDNAESITQIKVPCGMQLLTFSVKKGSALTVL